MSLCSPGHSRRPKLQGGKKVKGSHLWATYELCQRSNCLTNWRQFLSTPMFISTENNELGIIKSGNQL